jgi:hypothetical protein
MVWEFSLDDQGRYSFGYLEKNLIFGRLDGPLVKSHFFQLVAFKSGFHPHFLHLVVFSSFP